MGFGGPVKADHDNDNVNACNIWGGMNISPI